MQQQSTGARVHVQSGHTQKKQIDALSERAWNLPHATTGWSTKGELILIRTTKGCTQNLSDVVQDLTSKGRQKQCHAQAAC